MLESWDLSFKALPPFISLRFSVLKDTFENLEKGNDLEFSDEGFEEVFRDFDKDNSGTVEKDEMVEFLR